MSQKMERRQLDRRSGLRVLTYITCTLSIPFAVLLLFYLSREIECVVMDIRCDDQYYLMGLREQDFVLATWTQHLSDSSAAIEFEKTDDFLFRHGDSMSVGDRWERICDSFALKRKPILNSTRIVESYREHKWGMVRGTEVSIPLDEWTSKKGNEQLISWVERTTFVLDVRFLIIFMALPYAGSVIWICSSIIIRRIRKQKNCCLECGYNLTGATRRCPECGLWIEKINSH